MKWRSLFVGLAKFLLISFPPDFEKYDLVVLDGQVDLIVNFSNAPESQIEAQMSKLKAGGTVVNGNAASAQKMLKQVGGKGEKGVTMDGVGSVYENVNYIIFSVDFDTESLTKISKLVDEDYIKPFVTHRILWQLVKAHQG